MYQMNLNTRMDPNSRSVQTVARGTVVAMLCILSLAPTNEAQAQTLYGGGIEVADGSAIFDNVTIANNVANISHSGGIGGGIAIFSPLNGPSPKVILSNTILAGNLVNISVFPYIEGSDCGTDTDSILVSEGYNLLEFTNKCNFTSLGDDFTGISARLGPLQ